MSSNESPTGKRTVYKMQLICATFGPSLIFQTFPFHHLCYVRVSSCAAGSGFALSFPSGWSPPIASEGESTPDSVWFRKRLGESHLKFPHSSPNLVPKWMMDWGAIRSTFKGE